MNADIGDNRVSADRPSDRRDMGFTLLEVIVAVAIAALALVALFQAGSAGLLTVNEATRLEEAVGRAQSHLAEFADAGVIRPGESEGDDGGGYHWHLIARPIASQAGLPDQSAAPPELFGVDVTISWGTGRHRRSINLETERISAAGAAR
jgi:general secretion pathway protein I